MYASKNPASTMTHGLISSEGHVMPPHFFKVKERVNIIIVVLESQQPHWWTE